MNRKTTAVLCVVMMSLSLSVFAETPVGAKAAAQVVTKADPGPKDEPYTGSGILSNGPGCSIEGTAPREEGFVPSTYEHFIALAPEPVVPFHHIVLPSLDWTDLIRAYGRKP